MKSCSFNQERNGSLIGDQKTSTSELSVVLEIFKGDQETEKHGGSTQREGKQWVATLGKGVHTPTFISLAESSAWLYLFWWDIQEGNEPPSLNWFPPLQKGTKDSS